MTKHRYKNRGARLSCGVGLIGHCQYLTTDISYHVYTVVDREVEATLWRSKRNLMQRNMPPGARIGSNNAE